MTAEEKADRREVALKAAESRTKVWDKRLNKGRQASQAKTAGQEVSLQRTCFFCYVLLIAVLARWVSLTRTLGVLEGW